LPLGTPLRDASHPGLISLAWMSERDDQVTAAERALLVGGLEALGRAGGAAGGGAPGATGGARGARRAARRLREDRATEAVELPLPLDQADATVTALLAEAGTVLDQAPVAGAEHPERWALVGGGVGGLNPVVVRVELVPRADDATVATIHAVAKEGLIRQRAATKTAERLRDRLQDP
jgi:hypothetical protein